ncbi:competence protein CoiA family protein [Ferrimonas kyonanensis]|uniref:competence protein CoiA family protein n=1 Tax=Ferrimonas kyonanensis TaxID=364763 RepID=UPI0003F4EF66|nr:competence protein CoiA family protein [Ferrimonas kyonanensis]
MDGNLIPFGVCNTTGDLKDITEVTRGRACDCHCPSCSHPLVAKQGDIYIWHFAHSREDRDQEVACDLAFEASVRRMMVQLLNAGDLFTTPSQCYPLDICAKPKPILFCKEKTIRLREVESHRPNPFDESIDLGGTVDGFELFISLSRQPSQLDPRVSEEHHCGWLDLNLLPLRLQFADLKPGQGYVDALRQYLKELSKHSTWIYHPRMHQAAIKWDKQKEQLQAEPAPDLSWEPIYPSPSSSPRAEPPQVRIVEAPHEPLSSSKGSFERARATLREREVTAPPTKEQSDKDWAYWRSKFDNLKNPQRTASSVGDLMPAPRLQRFHCSGCGHTFERKKSASGVPTCLRCKTHLYVKPI